MAEVESVTNVQEEVVDPTEDSLTMLFRKIEELNVLSKWMNKSGKAIIRKNSKPARRRVSNGQKSGFAVPVRVDKSLAAFLEIDPNEHIPRTEVTKRLTKYIKDKSLQCENKKLFVCDEALAKVFAVDKGTQTNWFEMQKFLAKLLTSVKKEEMNDTTPAAAPPAAAPPAAAPPAAEQKKKLKKAA
jgi:chromatin remodeling complex protein RSC6